MENQNENKYGISNLLTETDLLDLLGINKLALGRLRNEQDLPFIKVSNNCRLYLEADIMAWVMSKRVNDKV